MLTPGSIDGIGLGGLNLLFKKLLDSSCSLCFISFYKKLHSFSFHSSRWNTFLLSCTFDSSTVAWVSLSNVILVDKHAILFVSLEHMIKSVRYCHLLWLFYVFLSFERTGGMLIEEQCWMQDWNMMFEVLIIEILDFRSWDNSSCNWWHESESRSWWSIAVCCYVGCTRCCWTL